MVVRLPTEPKNAQPDLNRRIRPGETARYRYVMGAFCLF
jgi:hypothetical protein